MPGTSRRFRGKVKNREWALNQRNNPPEISVRKKEVDDGESTGKEREGGKRREGVCLQAFGTEEDQRFVLCITMDIRSPILMSPGVWCSFHRADILWVNKWSLHGNQWKSLPQVFWTHSYLQWRHLTNGNLESRLTRIQKCGTKYILWIHFYIQMYWHFYQC